MQRSSRSGIPIPWLYRVAEFSRIDPSDQPTSDQEAILRREARDALETRLRIEARWREPRWKVIGIVL